MDKNNNTNHSIKAFGKWIIKKRWLIIIGSIIITLIADYGGERLSFNNGDHIKIEKHLSYGIYI